MKVFNLQCDQGHGFEGWFGSEDDYRSQTERGLLSCPVCGSVAVQRLPSAPRLNLGAAAPVDAARSTSTAVATTAPQVPPSGVPDVLAQLQARYLEAVRHVVANTEDVGPRFAEEVRRIHYGEVAQRAIRGQADAQEREALRDEGIDVVSLPLPPGMDGPLQ
ncbi:DUF1178 family protein [Sphaerotilus microaerophilus]|jgi:hypothetical protein|uniref:DUF1178 family protein n=1 Tax=Sphaerotilus microaerophilus TaxID=2914710 RepID=A0ABN6PKW1_9BURK|nr:DUF1178 family protein [Sphaerotilus sp. FB-5]BDI04609.1 hypothetical protein CATMQ487_15790 [Sphaerotilus sp. FB-5]